MLIQPQSQSPGSTAFKPLPYLSAPQGVRGTKNGQGMMNGISIPARVGYQDILPGVMQSIGQGPQLASVTTIPGFDDSFFDNLFDESKRKLTKETFGSGGLMERGTENLASRGLLGSSIERDTRGQVNDQYNEQVGSVLSDLNRLKTEQQIQEAQKVRELNQARDFKQADIDSALKELGLRSSLTEAADQSKYGLGIYEQQIKMEDVAAQDEQARRRLLLDLLSSPQVDIASGDQASIMNSIFGATGVNQGSTTAGGVKTGGSGDAVRLQIRTIDSQLAELEGRQFGTKMPEYQKLKAERADLINTLLGL